jgi:anti-sigma B factor antagonist
MHEAEQQIADRQCHAAPKRSHDSLAAEQTDGPRWAADTASGGLLAACEHHQDVAVLSVHGEVDLETAPALRETLLPVLEHQTGPVVVDLSEVSFMDSTGVHVLVDTLRRLELQNRRFAIACREGGQIHRLLALVGLLDALTVYRSRESAVLGSDYVLRSEPRRTSRPPEARAPTENLIPARQTTEC